MNLSIRELSEEARREAITGMSDERTENIVSYYLPEFISQAEAFGRLCGYDVTFRDETNDFILWNDYPPALVLAGAIRGSQPRIDEFEAFRVCLTLNDAGNSDPRVWDSRKHITGLPIDRVLIQALKGMNIMPETLRVDAEKALNHAYQIWSAEIHSEVTDEDAAMQYADDMGYTFTVEGEREL